MLQNHLILHLILLTQPEVTQCYEIVTHYPFRLYNNVNDPCKRRWRLDVQELNLIRGRRHSIHDKNEVRRVRKKVGDWLWSLS